MAGLLGFHRQQQSAAAGVFDLCSVLLQQTLWLGMGQLYAGGQCRQRIEGPQLDEAHIQISGAHLDFGHLCLRSGYV